MFKGRKKLNNNKILPAWNRIDKRGEIKYTINRELPILNILKEQVSQSVYKDIESLLIQIETYLPCDSLYMDMAKGGGSIEKSEVPDETDVYNELKSYLIKSKELGLSLRKVFDVFIRTQPYINYPSICERVEREIFDE